MAISAYDGLDTINAVLSRDVIAPGAFKTYTLILKQGVLHFGFYIENTDSNGSFNYNDFKRTQIVYDQQAEISFEKDPYPAICLKEYSYTLKVKDQPSQPVYRWDFGDGSEIMETAEPVAKHVYETTGDYILQVTLSDRKTGKDLAQAETLVTALNPFGSWQLNYTIEESGAVDTLITQAAKFFGQMIIQMFQLDGNVDDLAVTLRGTVIGCTLEVLPPTDVKSDEPIRVRLQQLTSSTEIFVDPATDVWEGILTVKDDQVVIKITAEGQAIGLNFSGTLAQDSLYGDFDAVVYSGSFQAGVDRCRQHRARSQISYSWSVARMAATILQT